MRNGDGALAAALGELAALGADQDREQVAALRDRLDAARLRVLVAGEAKRGKRMPPTVPAWRWRRANAA